MRTLFLACAIGLCAIAQLAPAQAAVPPLPTPQRSFDAGSLHVDVYGTSGRQPMIFIPGLTVGPWEWAGEIRDFSPQYTIYALTLPGFDGRTGAQSPLFATVAADSWTMLQTHGVSKPIVIGHSLGGTLALLLATQHPDRLAAVVALEGLPILPGSDRMTPPQREAQAASIKNQMAAATPEQFEAFSRAYTLPSMVTSSADVDAIASASARSNPAVSGEWFYEDSLLDVRPGLKNATVPILEIAPFDAAVDPKSQGSRPTAAAKQAYYASLLANAPNAKVVVVQPARHFAMYDQPAEVHTAIADFLHSHGL